MIICTVQKEKSMAVMSSEEGFARFCTECSLLFVDETLHAHIHHNKGTSVFLFKKRQKHIK